MAEEEKLLRDKAELLKWVQYSFTKPSNISNLSPKGQLIELAILEEFVNFKSWALTQIEA